MSSTQADLTAFGAEGDSIDAQINRLLNIQSIGNEATEEILSEIERTEAVEEGLATVDFNELVQDISAYGKRLRKAEPDAEGLTQYVWRMARYHSSKTGSRPVMADCWLMTYIDEQTDLNISRRDEEAKEIKDALQYIEVAASIELGHDPTAKARRMENVMF